MTAADAERMVEAAESAGVHLMEAFMYRHHPSWVAVRELVAAGRIGRADARSRAGSRTTTTTRRTSATSSISVAAPCFDIGCYCVNLSRMLFGGEPTGSTAAIGRDPASGVDVADERDPRLRRRHRELHLLDAAETDQRVHIYGTAGRISIGIPFNIPPDRPTSVFVTAGGDPPVAPATEVLEFPTADPYTVEAERLRGRDPRWPADPGTAVGRGREPAGDRVDLRGRASVRASAVPSK